MRLCNVYAGGRVVDQYHRTYVCSKAYSIERSRKEGITGKIQGKGNTG